jgi:putative methyltransferase
MARAAQELLNFAVEVLDNSGGGAGVKRVLYETNVKAHMKSQLTAIVLGVVKHKENLEKLAKEEKIFELLTTSGIHTNHNMVLALMYEAVLGSGRIRGTEPVVAVIKERKQSLRTALQRLDGKGGGASRQSNGMCFAFMKGTCTRGDACRFEHRVDFPRYVRVNLLRTTQQATLAHFKQQGYTFIAPSGTTPKVNLLSIPKDSFMVDPHVPQLLCFPPRTSMHMEREVDEGKLILQDRASCLSALALSPPAGAEVFDTCAAPGNKTSHLASIMGGDGRVIAFERNPQRCAMLRNRMEAVGAAGTVRVQEQDFTTVSPSDPQYAKVECALVDPSCSGSGNVAYLGSGGAELPENPATDENVQQLAADQLTLLLHVMSFPSMRQVVYSTCSIHKEEDEDVVAKVLKNNSDFELIEALPGWPHRGMKKLVGGSDIGPLVARASHDADSTNGFFVAKFQRKGTGDGSRNGSSGTEETQKKSKKRVRGKKRESGGASERQKKKGKQQQVVIKIKIRKA